MTQRLNAAQQSPELFKKLSDLSMAEAHSAIEETIRDLVHIRASQINGCTFCLDMHVKEAKIHGESELRLYHVAVWRESTLFIPRERAALAWTESLTRIAKTHAPDADYELVKSQFSESEIVALSILIGQINTWNRLQIAARFVHPVEVAKAA